MIEAVKLLQERSITRGIGAKGLILLHKRKDWIHVIQFITLFELDFLQYYDFGGC